MNRNQLPTSSSDCGAAGCRRYPWGIMVDNPFMWGGLDSGQINPYVLTSSTPTPTPDTTPPTLSAIGAHNITETSASIEWTTNEPATTQVEWGTSPSYGNTTALNSSLVTFWGPA